uniref:NADH dehydrogenase subunit 6 n=1 Tax=Pristionchus pacificus TaxID=54126 RepID=A0A8R1Z5L9_PRIPA
IMFFIISVVFCVLCFINLDPIKSRFFLIFSLLSRIPIISFRNHVWYSYFICLLFLSGIFVILVYFSSLSKINFVKRKLVLTSMFLIFILCAPVLIFSNENLRLVNFYYNRYWFFIAFIMLILLIFMNFSSYFLNFSGALRKI